MKNFRKHISVVLLAAFSFLVAPNELLHEFLSHHDTEDVTCTDVCEHHISIQHQHCDVLQLTTPPFNHTLNNFSFSSGGLLCALSFESTSSYHFSSSPFLFFRGPPAVS
ncbi:MAG: hypothetical protein JJE25_13735 [Bacteroidia bacterium]|nr:hypothetical protein [Bacteroidia bacterium]